MTTPELLYVKCAVSCVNSNGEADFYFCKVVCTEEQYDLGEHYNFTKEAAENEGYEPHLAYDEVECPAVMSLFTWSTADYIGPIGKPVTDRPTRRPDGFDAIADEIEKLQEADSWSEHPEHRRFDWSREAECGDTQLGYWDWVKHRIEENNEA